MTKITDKIPHWPLYRFSILVLAGIAIFYFLLPDFIYEKVWIIFVFFFLLTLFSMILIERLSKKNPKSFLAVYFSAMIGRLFISIIFASIFILTDRDHLFNFAINFLILYLLFLGFEIYGIITNLRAQNKKGDGNA